MKKRLKKPEKHFKKYRDNPRYCKHREKDKEILYVLRPTYPFGRKSKPRYRRVRLWGWICKNCGYKEKYGAY